MTTAAKRVPVTRTIVHYEGTDEKGRYRTGSTSDPGELARRCFGAGWQSLNVIAATRASGQGTTGPARVAAEEIVPWAEVRIGDAVLHCGSLKTVQDADAAYGQPGRRSLLIDGCWRYCRAAELTAVRRAATAAGTGSTA